MKRILKLVFLSALLMIVMVSIAQRPKLDAKGNLINMSEVNLSLMVQPVPKANQFIDSNYNIWCGSVIKTGNKYYMFYSRWPKVKGHEAWITDSEIALASSSKPGGPYKHVKVIFNQRGRNYWDGICTHNPAVIYYKGKYYLYYMGSTGSAAITPNFAYSRAWYNYRNNQRIGVAIANHPEDVWQRFDKPILDVSNDSTAYDAMMVSNPAITVNEKGTFILVYKQVEKNGTYQGGKVRFGVAFSNNAFGPFIKNKLPIFEEGKAIERNAWMIAEDPFIWNYKGINYAIVRDVIGKFTGEAGGLALLSSVNGIDWKPTTYPKVISKKIYSEQGNLFDDKLERPCLLMNKGVPIYLFGAMGINHRNHAMNIAVPLQSN